VPAGLDPGDPHSASAFRSIFRRSLSPEFEERAIVNVEQTVRDMDAEIRVDPDQMGIESPVVEPRQRQAVRDDRLPQLLVGVHDEVSGIEQLGFGDV
jgi:hypothetical protein